MFRWRVGITWFLILAETALTVLIPLFIGFAIDGLLSREFQPLVHLGTLMVALTLIGVIRRIYDTRVYGTIRVELGKAACRAVFEPANFNSERPDRNGA